MKMLRKISYACEKKTEFGSASPLFHFNMVDNVLYYKNVFVYLASTNSPLKPYVPVEDEWEKVIVIHKVLKLFYEVTYMFSVVKTPISNLYYKGTWMVHRYLLEVTWGPYEVLADMANRMLRKLSLIHI